MSASNDINNPLLSPLDLGPRTAPNRVMFGPHETNLGDGRMLSPRHVAYYEARAAGGAGVIVTEEASVHPSDWPYERCPSASDGDPGWAPVVTACRPHGSLVVAALGHSGGQGSSAFHQRALWAPSDEPEVNTREVPKIMEPEDIAAVIQGFASAATTARAADVDGVEINVGQNSLLRQFLSGLTNRRGDDYGADRALLLRQVLSAVRSAIGDEHILGVRLSCDEMAPWAGVTPEHAAEIAASIADDVDYLVVVRGSIFTVRETRPTLHHGTGFNLDLSQQIHTSVAGRTAVFAQGSIVDVDQAAWAVTDGRADGVEMTRAQIADAHLVRTLASGDATAIRPCVLCNQMCQVRDNRNPVVGCIGDPRSGHETTDVDPDASAPTRTTSVTVIGAGPAGLEAARVAASRGHRVRVVEKSDRVGGMATVAATTPAQARIENLVEWLATECRRLGVDFDLGTMATAADLRAAEGRVIVATGGSDGPLPCPTDGSASLLSAATALTQIDDIETAGPIVVWDPIGGPTGVAIAEALASRGHTVELATPDAIAGNLLALSGDLAGANVRLQQAGVTIHRRRKLRRVESGTVVLEHVATGEQDRVPVDLLIDASSRLPNPLEADSPTILAGDAVAPRTIGEAIREGRTAALSIETLSVDAGSTTGGGS